ncbi:methyltransferase domain-containing protein [Nocardia uniformis]|uniref:Methyltransferase domain-containing protein n=1 Tax=Nocardia uniformis TaxID=53432 RepID=A0A849BWL4_9NOCA|nr:class I SAM-dependent methyltransferase [Nocardia uniformis]NNH70952.1 methyltransferase domain-containing protein [Nocardia uniformis]
MTAAPAYSTPDRPHAGPAPRRGFNGLVARFFDIAAKGYDLAPLQYVMYRPPQDEMIALLRARGARTIVDFGCGTGILADRISFELPVARVHGVDMSAGMLAKARRRNVAVEWRNEPAERTGLPSASVDAVITTTAFHFFDQERAVAEFARILQPEGILAISAISTSSPWARPIQRISGNSLAPAHAPSPREIGQLVESLGFDLLEQRPIRRPWYSRMVPDVLTIAQRR